MSEQTTNFDEFYGYKFEELSVGQSAVYARTVTEADILMFAGVSGDYNPVHINEELAARYPYKRASLPVNRLEDGTLWHW